MPSYHKIESAKNPKWGTEDHAYIWLTVTIEDGTEHAFVASPLDFEDYGRDLFDRASRGEFGEVAVFEKEYNAFKGGMSKEELIEFAKKNGPKLSPPPIKGF